MALLLLVALFVVTGVSAGSNVILLVLDDLFSFEGNAHVRLPNLEALAAKGTWFQNQHVVKSDCAPSRIALLTAHTPDTTKTTSFKPDFRLNNKNLVTLPGLLRKSGYKTVSIGKVFDSVSFPEKLQVDKCIRGKERECSWDEVIIRDKKVTQQFCQVKNTEMYPSARKARGSAFAVHIFENSDEIYSPDNCTTQIATAYLRSLAADQRPFFLAIGWLSTHLPWVSPKRHYERYAALSDAEILGSVNRNSPFFRTQSQRFSFSGNIEMKQYKSWPRRDADKVRGYLAAASFMDEKVGAFMQAFDSLPSAVRENTMTIVWSDNGMHLGENGLWFKKTVFEGATKTPLIIVPPKSWADSHGFVAGRVDTSPVSAVDVFPTVLDILGKTDPDAPRSGTSLVPLMLGLQSSVRECAVSLYYAYRGDNGYQVKDIMAYSARTSTFRFVQYVLYNERKSRIDMAKTRGRVELYDYKTDGSTEAVNRATDPAYKHVVEKFRSIFLSRASKDWSHLIGLEPFDLGRT